MDVLAIVITGQPASWKNFLEETPTEGRKFVEGWIWPHAVTAWHGAKGSESPYFVGRAVAALAADADVARRNGGIYTTRALAEEYGFVEIDGTRPYAVFDAALEQAKHTFLAASIDAGRYTSVDWKLASKTDVGRVSPLDERAP